MTILAGRIETVVLGRLATSDATIVDRDLAVALRRFSPGSLTEVEWLEVVIAARGRCSTFEPRKELAHRLEVAQPWTWKRLAERVFPALGLGVSPSNGSMIAKLSGRDEWTAAIAGRALGIWNAGPPPSLPTVCDAYAWRSLGLAGRPKRCPPEVRALFLQRELHSDAGPPDRLLRLFAARELDAARPELRVLRDALVRKWLVGRELVPRSPSFADEVRRAARMTTRGLFGERKVFISAVWEELRRTGQWANLSLADLKTRLLAAQQAGDVELARADLVAAMDPTLVAASETQAKGATFHFIVREEV